MRKTMLKQRQVRFFFFLNLKLPPLFSHPKRSRFSLSFTLTERALVAQAEASEKRLSEGATTAEGARIDAGDEENAAPSSLPTATKTTTTTTTKTELPLASFYSRKRPEEYRDTEARVARLLAAVDARLGGVVAAANTRKKGGNRNGEEEEEEPPHLGFRVFRRQAEAFGAADAAGPAAALRVFSVELGGGDGSGNSMKRRSTWRAYVAATLPAFWRKYRNLAATDRHHYEILRESQPCHLFLDLEFKRKLNPAVDGDFVVDETVAAIRRVLARRWPRDPEVAEFDDADVLELDSSGDDKFSRHVTVRLRGFAFATVADAGAVVREAVYGVGEGEKKESGEGRSENGNGNENGGDGDRGAAAAEAAAEAPSLAPFARVVVSEQGENDDSSNVHFGSAVDLGVYTRNRAWRMALSSKVDAPARVLRPLARRYGGIAVVDENPEKSKTSTSTSSLPPPPTTPATAKISDRAAFFCGLAGDVPPGFKLLSVEGAVHGGGGGPPGRRSSSSSCSSSSFAGGGGNTFPSNSSLRARPGPSPFPAVDAFIEGLATSLTGDGRQAAVRSWAVAEGEASAAGQQQPRQQQQQHFSSPGPTLVLSLRDGRFCGGVGRPHRSNGVYYVVDLRGGTFRQRCHDPDCRGYRSPAAPLPADVARAAALFHLSLGGGGVPVPSPPPLASSSPFEAFDDDEVATRRFLEALDAAEAVALEERRKERNEEDDGNGNGDGESDDDQALFAAVDAAVAEAAAAKKRKSMTQEM